MSGGVFIVFLAAGMAVIAGALGWIAFEQARLARQLRDLNEMVLMGVNLLPAADDPEKI